MFIIKHKKVFLLISVVLVLLSLVSLFVFGLKIGIDFKGGTLMEVNYTGVVPPQDEIESTLQTLDVGGVVVQGAGESGYILKLRDVNDEEHAKILTALGMKGSATVIETNFNSIGPSVGKELTRKAIIAIILVSLVIICFIAFAFRQVSHPVSSWKYGFIAVVTLLHDVTIPVGLFVFLSRYYGAEVDTLFVVAILTVLGLSIADTIVIFDRIRENLRTQNASKGNFSEIVGKSLEQSYVRSICTSLTVILVLFALFFFGPVTTKYFALMLIAGMFFGTYSSIFLASPLLVGVEEWQNRNK